MDNLLIRKMHPTDIISITGMESEIFPDPWPQSAFVEHIENDNWYGIIAESDGKVIGYACFMIVADEAHLTNMAVAEEYRRKSVANQLMESILEELKCRECATMYLEVRVSNLSAIKFYEKLKFKELYFRNDYYRHPKEDALVMALDIII